MPSLRNDYVVLCDSCYKPIEGKSVMVNGKKPMGHLDVSRIPKRLRQRS
jgi:hypothetical protein